MRLINDPGLALPATVLDGDTMVDRFATHLQALNPELGWEVVRCAIEKIYYRHAHHCGILYRLSLRHPSGAEVDEWFFGRVCPPDNSCSQLERAVAAAKHFYMAHDFLRRIPPISFWPELDMVLWVFPQDPKILTLSYVVDPEFVGQQIHANLPALGDLGRNGFKNGAANGRGLEVSCRRVKYMPGKRCVLRFEVRSSARSGGSHPLSFYSKTYSDGWSRYHFDMLKSVHEQVTGRVPEVNVPRPLVYLDGYNTYWQEDWGGRALLDALPDQDWDELFPRLGEVMAAFHGSGINGFRQAPDTDDVLHTSIEDGRKLGYIMPQFESFVAPVLERLQIEKKSIDSQKLPAVPIHGACRVEQMLLKGAELALVDFDAVAIGDPLSDIAEFVASLLYLEISRGFSRDRLLRAAEMFCRRYAALVPWSCDYRRVEWYAQAFLLTKMYSSIKNLDFPALQRLELVGQRMIDGRLD